MDKSLAWTRDLDFNKPCLLLVADKPLLTQGLKFHLARYHRIHSVLSPQLALQLLNQNSFCPDLLLLDLTAASDTVSMTDALKLVSTLYENNPASNIIALVDNPAQNILLQQTDGISIDFISGSASLEFIKSRIHYHLSDSITHSASITPYDNTELIGESPAMVQLKQLIHQFSSTDFPVLIEGESGTGKERVAQALHQQGRRSTESFIAINCAALGDNLLESQLFGHVRGAFTGASRSHKGFFEVADRGTLFLDEISELSLPVQARLLRVLESGEFYPIGHTRCLYSRARIISASNKSLKDEVARGTFRSDLFHRLNILNITIPPLRHRGNDRNLLLNHFLYTLTDLQAVSFEQSAMQLWNQYAFPGNVRELINIIIRLCTRYPGHTIGRDQLRNEFQTRDSIYHQSSSIFDSSLIQQKIAQGDFNLRQSLEQLEQLVIQQTLDISRGNLSHAARLLHINRSTLYSRIHNRTHYHDSI